MSGIAEHRINDLIFARAQKYLAIDWLALDGHTDEADAKKIEEYYRYDERKEKRLSVVLAVVTAAGAAAAYYFGYQLMTAAALLLVALMANQHRVGRAVARKTLVRSIKCAFPGWLMDIVLLLQSENVQVALQKSQEHVPPVLRRDLDILVGTSCIPAAARSAARTVRSSSASCWIKTAWRSLSTMVSRP